MKNTPLFLRDARDSLSPDGFAITGIWYHGTSSVLLDSIMEQGLRRSGDNALNQVVESTMATIGNKYSRFTEPVFLTQSKELAYYWARQTVHERGMRFEGNEEPVVLAVTLSESQQSAVKPDVGAKGLLLMESGERFMAYLAKVYQECAVSGPDINLATADRMDFLNKLGMAYIDQDIGPACVEVLAE